MLGEEKNYKSLENIGSRHHQTNRDEGNNKKRIP